MLQEKKEPEAEKPAEPEEPQEPEKDADELSGPKALKTRNVGCFGAS